MADLDEKNSSGSTKIAGADATGAETFFVDATANGLKVDGSAVTQPISAVSLPLPTGAATEATLTKLPIAQNTALGSNSGPMQQAVVTTSDKSYTNNNINPLTQTTAGRLRVDADLKSGQLVPTITNKLRFRYAIADVTLPNTGVYQTIYSRSGTGLFFGTQLGFDNAKVAVRVTIDGGVVFDLSLDDVKKFEFNDTTDGRMQMGGFLTAVGNVFDFSSRFAIPYSTSILIEASSTDGSNHKLKQYMSIHTEDT